ncbi:MAG: hypothetical protein WC385_01445 [Candidatus Paceibacterota bacterium]|jgi:ppGpp synthetase/RelA/SpoT-type nucleotidyltranferase
MFNDLFKTLRALFLGFNIPNRHTARREKIILEYKNQKPLHEAFSLVMKKLIEALLSQGKYKYQLSVRVKDIEKLEEKIERKHNLGARYKRLSDIEDLVGIRIIFYTEADKEAFLKDLKNEIMGNIRIEEIERDSGYMATHAIVSLGRRRLKLVEYEPFKGLKCEIQITSAIYHAWAELEHDLIYKDINGLEKLYPDKYKLAKEKLREILNKYIKRAVAEFEEVMREINDRKDWGGK